MINIVSYSTAKGGSGKGGSGGGGSVTNYNTYTGIQPLYLWGNYFDGTSDIEGNLTSNGTIRANDIITKNSIRANIIDVLSATTEYFKTISIDASGDANIGGGTHIHQDLQVDGSTNIGGGASIGGNTTISGSTSMTGDLYSGGGARIGGNTTISGSTSMTGDLYSGGSARIDDNATIGGNVNISGSTFTEGSSTVHHDMTVGGDGKIYGDAVISGTTTTTDIYSENITNTGTIRTKDLEVTGTAHFFELIIDKIKAAGGAILLTPADGFRVDYVEDVTNGKKLYFRSTDNSGRGIMNMWKAGDQAICQSFNQAQVGTSYNVSNKYWWSLVTFATEQPVSKQVSGETNDYHYIIISTEEGYDEQGRPYYDGTINCEVGDEVAMLGYRGTDEPQRQSAIYMAAYRSVDLGLTAPHFAEYQGINDFNLASHRRSYIDANGAKFVGYLYVDANTSVQDYITNETTEIRNEFKFDIDGLSSRVEHKSRPNIVSNNDWHDQDNAPLYQENDELYEVSGTTECTAYPPVMYLNAGTYTPSIYGYGKFKTIRYGESKNNLENYLPVETMINFNDTWNDLPRAQSIFIAPIDGYYGIGVQLMDESYSGDTAYYDYIGDGGGSGSGSTSGETVQTTISLTAADDIKVNRTKFTNVDIYPPTYNKVVYRSSNPSVVSVDEYGRIHGTGEGHALIYAFIPEGYSGGYHYLPSEDYKNVQCVVSAQTTTLLVAPEGMLSGQTGMLGSYVTPSDYPGTTRYVSEDPGIIAIIDNNTISGVTSGTTTITAYTDEVEVNGYKWMASSDSKQVTVRDYNRLPSSVQVSLPSNMIAVDVTINTLEITTTPPGMDYVLRTSSGGRVVRVNPDGTYTGVSAGKDYIIATTLPMISGDTLYESSSGTSWEITCFATGQTSCAISVDSPVYIGFTKQTSYSKTPSNYMHYTFSSSDESVATVDSSGLITGVGEGTCDITLKLNDGLANKIYYYGSSATTQVTCEMKVEDSSVSMTVTNPSSLTQGKTTSVSVTTNPSGAEYTLTSSNPSIIEVVNNTTLRAVNLGTATITVNVPTFIRDNIRYNASSASTQVTCAYDYVNSSVSFNIPSGIPVRMSSNTPTDTYMIRTGQVTPITTTTIPSELTVNYYDGNYGYHLSVDKNGISGLTGTYNVYNLTATVPEQTLGNHTYRTSNTSLRYLVVNGILEYETTDNKRVTGDTNYPKNNYCNGVFSDGSKFYVGFVGSTNNGFKSQQFENATTLRKIDFLDTVVNIGDYAFHGCSSLSEIEFESTFPSIKTVGAGAFKDCTSLASTIYIGEASSIGSEAFMNCPLITDIYIMSYSYMPTIGSNAFNRNNGAKFGTLHVTDRLLSRFQSNSECKKYFENIVAIQ